jgi:hypothetical protein
MIFSKAHEVSLARTTTHASVNRVFICDWQKKGTSRSWVDQLAGKPEEKTETAKS